LTGLYFIKHIQYIQICRKDSKKRFAHKEDGDKQQVKQPTVTNPSIPTTKRAKKRNETHPR